MKRILSSLMLFFVLTLWALPIVQAATAPIYIGGIATTELNYSSTGYQTVVTGSSSGSTPGTKVYNLTVTSTDTTTAHTVTCQILSASAGTVGLNISVSVLAGAGGATLANPAQNLLTSFSGLQYDQNNNQFLSLASGNVLQCNYATALGAGTLNIYAAYANY